MSDKDSKSGLAATGLGAALFLALPALAQGVIETPAVGETASGIGTVSGWHCTARSVTLKIDNYPELTAGSRTERNDTSGICGAGNVNTGYSLLFNFNDLPVGAHTVVASADGVEFARAPFNTATLGSAFLTGRSARRMVRNFPDMNQSVLLQWQENRQNFSIVGRGNGTTATPSPLGGTYYGAVGTQCLTDPQPTMTDERFARFDVVGSPDNQSLSVTVRYQDGFQCSLSGPMAAGGDGYYVVASPTSTCQLGNANLRIEVDGLRVKGVVGSTGGTGCFTTRAFYGTKPYRLE